MKIKIIARNLATTLVVSSIFMGEVASVIYRALGVIVSFVIISLLFGTLDEVKLRNNDRIGN